MKEQAHNEIDLMLRKLGSAGSGAPENGNHIATSSNANEHLDADELNLYAENVLPLKTRARYTEHLADCQQCRQIVSQLSQAAGIVIVEEKKKATQKESKATGFWAMLFSPVMLKYALPAVLLIAIGSIGYFTLLQSNQKAMKTDAEQLAKNVDQPPTSATALSSPEDNRPKVADPQSSPATQPEAAKVNKEETKTDSAKEAKREEPATVDSLAAANEPAAPAPPAARHDVAAVKPAESEEKRPVNNEVATNRNQGISGPQAGANITNVQPRPVAKNEGADKKLEDDEGETRKAKTTTAARGQSQARAAQQQQEPFRDRGRRRQDKDDDETRSVAGRYFHRESGVWIDSAYNPSNAMTRISRGSEQFRALVADEPEIKRIADQLPGDVIVVWKGRVYRIE